MQDRYVFPAVLTFSEDGITVEFPDLPGCVTCGKSDGEAVEMAREALGLHLYGLETDHETIPTPSRLSSLKTEPNQVLAMVDVWMPPLRRGIEQRAIKKTLTLPKWLNDLAEKEGVNFSQLLQHAIKEHLGIKEQA
jgi:predicted RNase H-like HicB family nuclease